MTIPEQTEEQAQIIGETGNCIVVASPGSGKTFTISQKIRQILPTLPSYKGVIAISFTNKASDELERRCLFDGLDGKASFFGTIDKFQLLEVIFPFIHQVWGVPEREVDIRELKELENHEEIGEALKAQTYEENLRFLPLFQNLYMNGEIILEALGFLGLYVLTGSPSCRRYLKARYSHIFVDEYQDCDKWQHSLFIRLTNVGICGIAVGDPAQSIFAFANKDAKYLTELAQDDKAFNVYPLTINHRCHKSIIGYSTRLLSDTFHPPKQAPEDVNGVYEKWVEGTEEEIGEWISGAVEFFERRLNIPRRNEIAVLVRNGRTGDLINQSMRTPHKYIIRTPLDDDASQWGSLYRRILTWIFESNITKREFVEKYFDYELQSKAAKQVMRTLGELKAAASTDPSILLAYTDAFLDISYQTFPTWENKKAQSNLEKTLSDWNLLSSFVPPQSEEIQIMSLHKAKGLEFDLVFHLDMYRWILPQYNGDFTQDLNLHYVGITRARKCCVLCGSTQRHRPNGEVVVAEESEFMSLHSLENWRSICPI